ncbi:MAG: peptidoglycan/LPS O-acetylase OafA/YrhL [Cyclobacteriaceae bacterium]|jgi:peptidoglycan/LPS O-acetylase OafA/YrhL
MHDPNFSYRPDIDGLRAIAVVSVIVFHAFPSVLPGGYIGVDIFFVISGFLITSIIEREIADHSFSIKSFYLKRIKRLFPALIVVLSATLLFGWVALFQDEFNQVGEHAAASVIFLANVSFWKETSDYFDTASELKPLLHLWSLGVEEQFYLVWPLIIALIVRLQFNFSLVVLLLIVASFLIGINTVESYKSFSFYLPFTRFWELAVGGLLASSFFKMKGKNWSLDVQRVQAKHANIFAELFSILGLSLIVFSLFYIDESKNFPGWWAIPSVLGATFLIGAGNNTFISRKLTSSPVVVYIGLISYPLYLWHWPILSYANIIYRELPSVELKLILVLTAIILAVLTYKFVELPIRKKAKQANYSNLFVKSFIICMLAIFCLGIMIKFDLIKSRLFHVGQTIVEASSDYDTVGKGVEIVKGKNPNNVLFLGDSYIQQFSPRIELIVKNNFENSYSAIFNIAPGCVPITIIDRKSTARDCLTLTKPGIDLAYRESTKVVVIGASWIGMLDRGDYHYRNDPTKEMIDFSDQGELLKVMTSLENFISSLNQREKKVYLLLNPPGGEESGADPKNVSFRLDIDPELDIKEIPVSDHHQRVAFMNDLLIEVAARTGTNLIDPQDWFCDNQNCKFTDEIGVPYFKDSTHIRSTYVKCCVTAFDELMMAPNY